jgi:hypothetical protein
MLALTFLEAERCISRTCTKFEKLNGVGCSGGYQKKKLTEGLFLYKIPKTDGRTSFGIVFSPHCDLSRDEWFVWVPSEDHMKKFPEIFLDYLKVNAINGQLKLGDVL